MEVGVLEAGCFRKGVVPSHTRKTPDSTRTTEPREPHFENNLLSKDYRFHRFEETKSHGNHENHEIIFLKTAP